MVGSAPAATRREILYINAAPSIASTDESTPAAES
jgi:hypothetical protein